MIDPKEAFKYIRRLQIKALRHVDDLFAGNYHSAFKGKGLEFEDVREYRPGDDIRSIDWNVTARSQHPYVKNYREERELTVILAVDISASSRFGHMERLKSELVAEIGALLAFSAIKNHDKVGLLLFTNQIELYLKPKKGVRHVLRVIRELLYFAPKNRGTDIPSALSFLGRIQRRRVICFLISDFLSEDFSRQAALIGKRHELIAFHISDSYEDFFSPYGLFTLSDLESKEIAVIDTGDPDVRENFRLKAEAQASATKRLFERIGASYMRMHTEESSKTFLQRFFQLRRLKK